MWWKQGKQTIVRRTVTVNQYERIGGRMISPMKDKRDKTIDKKGKKSWTSDNEITIVQRVESSLVTMRGVKRNKEDIWQKRRKTVIRITIYLQVHMRSMPASGYQTETVHCL